MKMHTALGGAGAARGIEPEGSVVLVRRLGDKIGGCAFEQALQVRIPTSMANCSRDYDVAKVTEPIFGNLFDQRNEVLMNDGDAGTRVGEHMFVFVSLGGCADGDRDGANLDSSEKAVEEFGNVGK